MQFHLDNMTCGGCARTVTKAIHSVDSSAIVNADPKTRLITVETTASQEKIVTVLREAGYPPRQ